MCSFSFAITIFIHFSIHFFSKYTIFIANGQVFSIVEVLYFYTVERIQFLKIYMINLSLCFDDFLEFVKGFSKSILFEEFATILRAV